MAFLSHEHSVQNQNVIGQSLLQISKFRSSTVYSNRNQSLSRMMTSQQNISLLLVEFEIWLAYVAFFPHQRWRLECSRGSAQAAGNPPDPSLSSLLEGSGNQTTLYTD